MKSEFLIREKQILNILYLMLIFLPLSSLANYFNNRIEFTYLYLLSAVLTIYIFLKFKKKRNINRISEYILALLFIIFFSFLFLGEQNTFDIFWVLVLPMVAVMIEKYKNIKKWLYLFLFLLVLSLILSYTNLKIINYDSFALWSLLWAGIFMSYMSYDYKKTQNTLRKEIKKYQNNLERKVSDATKEILDLNRDIEDAILNKPGKLTSEEFTVMKAHSKIGEAILAKSNKPLIQMASEIAGGHHEKYDGSGYPRGLKAQDIPLSARIVAIADVFDALCSKRVYKDAWSLEKIKDFFEENSGSHFDPKLVFLFLENIDTFIQINQENK